MEISEKGNKKFLLPSSQKGKKLIFSILFFVLLGSLFPFFSFAQEGFFPLIGPTISLGRGLFSLFQTAGRAIGGIAGAIAGAIAVMIVSLFYALSAVWLEFARLVLGWATDPGFLISTYTSGGVVDVGWPVVRDLANMLIVLALIFIGLGTALRLQEYQAKKTLPLLIGVALLINFTPVILGVIVDATNIVMNFFLSGISGAESVSSRFQGIGSTIASTLSNISFFDPLANIALLLQVMVMVAYNVFAGIIFFLFAILFIIRRVAIWMLVILSPLAFASYILPATRGFFNQWWNQFWQWTTIGVFAAFFLWLGDHMIGITVTEPGGSFLDEVLPVGVALIFLLIGFFVALSTSAMGAAGIVAGGQKFGKAVPRVLKDEAWGRGKTYAKEKWQKSPMAERISKRLSQAQAPKEVTIAGRKIPVVSQVAKWGAAASAPAVRAIGRAGLAAREIGLTDVGREEEEAKKRGVEMKASHLLSPEKTKTQRVATYLAAYEQNQLKALEANLPEEKREEMTKQIGREAMEIHPEVFKRFAKSRGGEFAEEIAKGFTEERKMAAGAVLTDEDTKKGYQTLIQKITAEMKSEEIAKMAPSSLRSAEVKESIHAFWGGPQIASAARTFGREFIDSFNEEMQRRGGNWYRKHNNTKALTYVNRNAAKELGFMSPPEKGTEDVPGPQPPPSPPPPGGPSPGGPSEPMGRPGPGMGPRRPPSGRPGPGVSGEKIEEIIKEEVERRRQRGEEELGRQGWPGGRPGIGV